MDSESRSPQRKHHPKRDAAARAAQRKRARLAREAIGCPLCLKRYTGRALVKHLKHFHDGCVMTLIWAQALVP